MTAPDNQQERLDDYLAGYVDGEGSFHVAIQRNPSTRFGWQLVPEFHVSQNPERSSSSCEPGSAAAESGPTPGLEVGTGRSSTWYGTATIF